MEQTPVDLLMGSWMESNPKNNYTISNIQDLLDIVKSTTFGIIWLTEDRISTRSGAYPWLNYLLDGVIEKQLCELPESDQSLFIGENFGNPFSVFQTLQATATPQSLEQAYNLMKKGNEDCNDMIVICSETAKCQELIKKGVLNKHPQVQIKMVAVDLDNTNDVSHP